MEGNEKIRHEKRPNSEAQDRAVSLKATDNVKGPAVFAERETEYLRSPKVVE